MSNIMTNAGDNAVRFGKLMLLRIFQKRVMSKPASHEMSRASNRPSSASDFALSLMALFVALSLLWIVAPWHAHPQLRAMVPYMPVVPCLGIALVFWIGQFVASSHGHNAQATCAIVRSFSLQRVWVRCCGVLSTVTSVAVIYWLLPEYHSDFYEPFWQFLTTLAPLAILVPFYLAWADRRFSAEDDEYFEFGNLVLHGWARVDRDVINRHLLGWLVKAFFLPLMVVFLDKETNAFYLALQDAATGPQHRFLILYHLSYTADLLFAVVGYTAMMRLFDNHLRSAEPTVGGWVVALICYMPFYSVIGSSYLAYGDNVNWDNLLQPWPALHCAWGILIVSCTLTYGLSTAAFGLRFSNLTNRGIITDGPYRFTKHPAYLSKNLSWWLISVPMFSELGWPAAIRNCCLLAATNLVYFARARTEERHLSQDPAYVAYALWIDEHGIFRHLSKWLPRLGYRPQHASARAGSWAAQIEARRPPSM
jgi:protein-S-isoprenylcysteine O-methyltransferase Ste14